MHRSLDIFLIERSDMSIGGRTRRRLSVELDRTMRQFITAAGFAVVAALFSGCQREAPVERRLADCTNSTLRFQMTVQEFPAYYFVLGMPQTATGQLSFHGEVVVSQSTGTVARVAIGSDDITPCNWLHGFSGYILNWGRTNQADRLESFLKRGQTYDVEVRFSEPPRQRVRFGCRRWGELAHDSLRFLRYLLFNPTARIEVRFPPVLLSVPACPVIRKRPNPRRPLPFARDWIRSIFCADSSSS